MKRFTHLQPDELSKISALFAAGVSPSAIADGLTRHVSTIRRELGRCKGAYNERDAQANRRAARASCAANAQRFGAEHWARVELGLCQLRSPEQIVGRAWTLGEAALPCSSRIYTWLAERCEHEPHFCHGKRVRRYGKRSEQRKRAHPGSWVARVRPIAERPAHINERTTFGHWEIDTVEGRKSDSPRVLVAIERQSLLVKLARLPKNSALAVHKALKAWRGRTRGLFQSLTTDQGCEFAHLDRFLPAEQIFACDAHSPWQKGIVENCNGLLRFYVPKGEPISDYSAEYLQYVEDMLNDRPRRSLDWMTPREVASLLRPTSRAI